MKVLSWIFTILSFLAIPVMFIIWAALKTGDEWWVILLIGVALYAVFGLIAHLCIKGDFEYEESGTKFLYYSSFPAYVILFVVYILIACVIKLIKYIYI